MPHLDPEATRQWAHSTALALVAQWQEEMREKRRLHAGETQCWRCGEWYDDSPEVETCPHCGADVVPFWPPPRRA